MTRSLRLLLGITAAIGLVAGAAVTARANPAAVAAGDVVLLNFSASWCGPCRQMAPLVGEITAAGWVVRHVDVDHEGDLVRRFAVTGVPCYVLLVKGQEVGRINGATTRGELENLLAKSRQPLGLAPAAVAATATPPAAAGPAATPVAGIPLPVTPAAAPLATEPPAPPQVAAAAILSPSAAVAADPAERPAAPPRSRQQAQPAAVANNQSPGGGARAPPPRGAAARRRHAPPRRGVGGA
ncbi:MAG: thioredoxin family protein, partial [Planctomycetia bacterium]